MDLRHMRAFIAVADALSVTKAAERLHISQPPLSRHIHQLENELGVTLFVRHRQGVTLTEAGHRLLEKARLLDAAAADFYEAASETRRGDSPRIRIGIGWGLWDAVNRIRVEFSQRQPKVAIEARDAFCSEDSERQLKDHSLDVVIGRPPLDTDLLDVVPIFSEPIQAVVSDASPLARRETLWVRDVLAEPILLWDRHVSPVLYDRILNLVAHTGIDPVLIPTPGAGPYNHAGVMMVASGKGTYLCLGLPMTSSHPTSGVVALPLADPEATIEVCVAHRKGAMSSTLAEFVECVWHVFPEHRALTPAGSSRASQSDGSERRRALYGGAGGAFSAADSGAGGIRAAGAPRRASGRR
jgi:DNA-binding transcriptional LysR family regulator